MKKFPWACVALTALSLYSSSLLAANFSASFKNTDIREFIDTVGRNLNKTILVDPSVQGTVSVRTYNVLSEDEYYQFFLSVLDVYGLSVIPMDNGMVKVVRSSVARTAGVPVADSKNPGKGDEIITRVVRMENVPVRELAPLLRQLNDASGTGNVVHFEPSNVLLLTGKASVVNRLVDLVQRVDKDGVQRREIVPLRYASAKELSDICRKELATMFAHFAQETGGHESWRPEAEWRQALVHVREMGWTEGQKGGYNGECNPTIWQGQTWPCGKDKDGDFLSYFGRGAKQLSYNYNYGPFSEAMYGDVRTLLDKPELVADTWLNLASAIFFFAYPQPPKPSMLQVIDGTWQPNDHDKASGLVPGFGVTTQIINGGVECGGPTEIAQSQNRIKYYKEFANYLKVPVPANEVLGCANMKQFDEGGSGALKIYWEQDWGWSADTPDGKTYSCQLVGYQTPFSAFKEGDYSKCVQKFYNVNIVNDDGSATTPNETPVTPTPSEDETPTPTPTPVPDETPAEPAVVNHAPVAQIAGPVGAVEAGAQVSLSAEGSTDADGNTMTYTWRAQDGQTVTGQDKAVVTFTAPEAATAQQYEVSLTVSDGELSSTTSYLLNVKAKAAAPSQDEGSASSYSAWSANSKYKAGDIVNNHGKLFQCKPFPYSGWCNNAPAYYEPGAGLAWSDAWTAL